jgi:protein-histidine N-methyltransferase
MLEDMSMIRNLVGWAGEHQTSLHQDVEVYQDHLTGLSFRAKKSLPPGTVIVNSSYQTTLSYLNAISASPVFQNHESVLFPPTFIDALKQEDPNIIGHFFLVQQFLMGEKSFWSPYIKLLPQPNEPDRLAIPIWWSDADRQFLDGTNAEPPIKKREAMWRAEWTKGITLLREEFEHFETYTYYLYQWAATIFGSRSFRASLTIPEGLLRHSETSPDHRPLTLDHIRKDRFSVLLPLMDIGNHNGVNQVDWLSDAIAGQFSLSTRDPIAEGSQIFNFYGNKSNSELLVAYGFILPNPENDCFNFQLTPRLDEMQLRRSQFCHVRHHHTQPKQEFMFHVKKGNGKAELQDVLTSFSEGLIDTMICMAANDREKEFILGNPGYCVEKDAAPLGGHLSRAFIKSLSLICEKIQHEMDRIVAYGAKLRSVIQLSSTYSSNSNDSREPQNQNNRVALEYRLNQLGVLEVVYEPAMDFLQQAFAFNCLCPHGTEKIRSPDTNVAAQFISLECAFGWLQKDYCGEYDAVIKLIAEDQEEPLPLNWAILVEDWDRTYWIVWILLLWMLWFRNPDEFEIRCRHDVCAWQLGWYS